MLKRILTASILLITVLASGYPLFCPFFYSDTVARAESGPDLTVEAITSSPESPAIGDKVTFTIVIGNQGTVTSGQCYVAYYIDDNYLANDYVSSIGPSASAEHTFTWTAEVGTHTVKAVVDYREQVTESNESNNQKTYTLSTLGPDLSIDSITWSPSDPNVGSTVIFNVTIRNQGAVAANSNRVDFYIDGISRGYKDVERINPGGTLTKTFSWFAKAGTHDIKAIVDENDAVPETDEDNNEMTVLFSALLPDLIIDDISWSPTEPSLSDNVSFTVTVTNQGSGVSGNSTINFYVDDTYLDTERTSKLEAGASENVTFSWIVVVGTHDIKVVIVTGGVITESDETNNEKTVTFSPHLADLIVHSITWSPTNPSIGDNVTFTMTIKNQGSGGSAESGVDLLIDDVNADYKALGQIEAGGTAEVTFTWRVKAGTHQIKAIVDLQKDVPESEESNNEKTITFVPLPPDLIVEQITWTPSEPSIGDTVTFTVTVKNQGEANADYSYIAYYIDNIQITSDRVNPISINATANQTFTWTATAGEHAIKAFVDFTKRVAESDETNNEKVTALTPAGPDLIIDSIDWSHNDPPAGEMVTFTLTIKNNGGSRAGTSLVHLYIDNNLRGFQDIPELETGATATRTFSWKVAAGPHAVRAVVDGSDLVAENNEENNEILITYPAPDLVFESVIWSPINPSMGDRVTLTAKVKNQGSLKAGSFQVYFYVDENLITTQEIPQLDAGARVTNTFEWDVSAGEHILTVFVDGANTITEGAESNNTETINLSIPAPDLIIESITWPSGEPSSSDNVSFTVTIRNQGDAKALFAYVKYYLDGEYLASGQVNSLEPDANTEESFGTWISQAGRHVIRVVIDEENRVLESDEENNEKLVTFTTENVTSPVEPATGKKPQSTRPAPIPLTPPEEKDYKVPILFGIVVVIFGVALILSLLREMRKRR